MKKIFFTLVLLTSTVSAYSQLLNWNATQNKANSISPKSDANGDGEVDISDVVFVVNEILSGDSYQESCDVNNDGYVDITDVVELVNIILNGNQTNLCPDNNHPHMIDLDLPSGIKWACCNVGADKPEDYGDYFAWGETTPQSSNQYYWDSYKWCKGSSLTMTKYCNKKVYGYNGFTDGNTILDAEDDAARVNWNGDWRMPNEINFHELINYTTNEWTTVNGVTGPKFTSKTNGNSIFLPAAGYRWYSELLSADECGIYWSSTLNDGSPFNARTLDCLKLEEVFVNAYGGYRSSGFSVRPVR